MQTKVETFITEETSVLIYDNEQLDEWNDLVFRLELKGQEKVYKPDKSPIPFMHLKKSLENVFEVLCPSKTSVEGYSLTPIPVEILSLISLSKNERYFEKIEIWYDDKAPDPVCIGIAGHWYQGNWYDDRNRNLDNKIFATKQECLDAGANKDRVYFNESAKYLIGKWSDVKHSFDQLKEMARKRYIAQESNNQKKIIKDAQRKIEDLETDAFDKFN